MTWPGFMVSFEVFGGAPAAEAVARSARLIVHATSLGGIETTIERRARWPGEETTPPALLRLSVGCEDVDDLWHDLDHALRIGAYAAIPGPTPVAFAGIVGPSTGTGRTATLPDAEPSQRLSDRSGGELPESQMQNSLPSGSAMRNQFVPCSSNESVWTRRAPSATRRSASALDVGDVDVEMHPVLRGLRF